MQNSQVNSTTTGPGIVYRLTPEQAIEYSMLIHRMQRIEKGIAQAKRKIKEIKRLIDNGNRIANLKTDAQ